jgi:hypothetical protein
MSSKVDPKVTCLKEVCCGIGLIHKLEHEWLPEAKMWFNSFLFFLHLPALKYHLLPLNVILGSKLSYIDLICLIVLEEENQLGCQPLPTEFLVQWFSYGHTLFCVKNTLFLGLCIFLCVKLQCHLIYTFFFFCFLILNIMVWIILRYWAFFFFLLVLGIEPKASC